MTLTRALQDKLEDCFSTLSGVVLVQEKFYCLLPENTFYLLTGSQDKLHHVTSIMQLVAMFLIVLHCELEKLLHGPFALQPLIQI